MDTGASVLVTGGAGYIGSHACKALALAGRRPIAYDNLVYGHGSAVKWGPFVHGDILDRERLEWAFREHRITAVMHFAAYAYVGESVGDPAKYYRNNVTGALTLLDAMRARGVSKFVFSSSCATYGVPSTPLIAETHAQAPVNPYGRSKLMIEQALSDYGLAYGLSSVALRYFNAAGADPDGEIGETHDPETHLIPLVLQTAAGLRSQITVFGDDYDTPDGTCLRDYIHVSDLAQAHVLALESLTGTGGVTPYNLGVGKGFSVQEIIAAAREITGRPIQVEMGARRAGDPPALVADASAARRGLGWTPQHSGMEEMIASAWRWLRKQSASTR
jgi:UDP-arabinose 4-epimerase